MSGLPANFFSSPNATTFCWMGKSPAISPPRMPGQISGIDALVGPLVPVPAQRPDGPEPFDMGPGRQWFPARSMTEENRPARIAAAQPAIAQTLGAFGDPRESLVIGFSQGAIMALHGVAEGLTAAGVFALSGSLAFSVLAGQTDSDSLISRLIRFCQDFGGPLRLRFNTILPRGTAPAATHAPWVSQVRA